MKYRFFGSNFKVSWETIPSKPEAIVKVEDNNTKLVDKKLTDKNDTLTWSSQVNYTSSSGVIKITRSQKESKYALWLKFKLVNNDKSKSFNAAIDHWS